MVRLAPVRVPVRVRDSLTCGRGLQVPSSLGMFPVVRILVEPDPAPEGLDRTTYRGREELVQRRIRDTRERRRRPLGQDGPP